MEIDTPATQTLRKVNVNFVSV